jgi:hypothetical protein
MQVPASHLDSAACCCYMNIYSAIAVGAEERGNEKSRRMLRGISCEYLAQR